MSERPDADAPDTHDPPAAPDLGEPVPIRVHDDRFGADLDVATLGAAGIPAKVIEPDGGAGGAAMGAMMSAAVGPGRPAVVLVPANHRDEAMAVLDAAGDVDPDDDAWADGDADGAAVDGEEAMYQPRSSRPLPWFVLLGLVLAIGLVLISVVAAIVMLVVRP